MTRRIAVVGGGITGLTTAWSLHRAGHDVVCFEASERAGGKLREESLAGGQFEVGADSFLARHGAATDLARQLGLGEELVEPSTGTVWLWIGGRLRRMPAGTVMGAPTDLLALARSRVLSRGGLLRAAAEAAVPATSPTADVSVGDLVARRYGREVVDVLVEPLLGGVYAGDPWRLSARATTPMLLDAMREHRSMAHGLQAYRAASPPGPVFQTLRGGLGLMVDRLVRDLGDRVRCGRSVTGIRQRRDGWTVVVDEAEHEVDAVVLTTPAFLSARLLADTAPAAAADLGAIEYASVAVVTMAYGADAETALPAGSGMLVPRREGRLVKASTWVTRKWPHRRQDHLVVRASVGRVDDDRWQGLDEDELIARVDAEIRWATGLPRPPEHAVVTPWPDALPQYVVGHQARVGRIRANLPKGIHVAGAAFDGIGVSPCIASGHAAANAAGSV